MIKKLWFFAFITMISFSILSCFIEVDDICNDGNVRGGGTCSGGGYGSGNCGTYSSGGHGGGSCGAYGGSGHGGGGCGAYGSSGSGSGGCCTCNGSSSGGGGTPTPTTYTVTVNNGDGSGSYTAGVIVTISANIPSGQQFDYWTVDSGNAILADEYDEITTFTMPSRAVTVTAAYFSEESIPMKVTW